MKTKIFLSFILLFCTTVELSAQLDTKHWIPPFFAKSENNSGIGDIREHFVSLSTPTLDTIPVVIRDGYQQVIDTVWISRNMPMEYTFSPLGFMTGDPLTSVYPLNIIPRDSLNMPIRSQGLYFESFQPFFVNMRHKSNSQGMSLTSKGQVGLGTEFYTGHVHTIRNAGSSAEMWNDERRSHFISVMATEDSTEVTIDMVKNPIVFINQTVPQGEPITVTLNAFESYVVGVDHNNLTNEDINNLNGTRVSSDKPIVCNSGSWLSGNQGGQCIGADQLVTSEVTGQEYILVRGLGDDTTERPCVVATEDGTEVFLNDQTLPVAVLDEGEFYFVETEEFTDNNNMYIRATERVYVYQTSSGSSEREGQTVGLNFIPPLNCVGAKEVNLPFVESLGTGRVNIITKFGTSIFINDNVTPLTGAQTVLGNSEWITYAFDPTTTNVNIVSDSVMNVALLTRDENVGSAGYFSGFTLEPVVGLSSEIIDEEPCIPGNAVLQVFGFDAYQWFFEGVPIEGATGSTLIPSFAGEYSVEGIDIACGFRFPSNPFTIPFCPSTLGAAKVVESVQETSAGSRIFDVTYRIFVENLAESASQNLQMIEDISVGLPPGATSELIGAPSLQFGFVTGGLNPNFDGITDTKLLPGTGFLSGTGGQNQDAISLTIRIDMNNATSDGYFNQAIVTSINEGVNDGFTGPFNGQDFSDDGTAVDPDGDGEPNEEGENDPNLTCFFPNTFEYSQEIYCSTDEMQEITLNGVSSGLFTTSESGLSIVDTTGVIRPQESTPGTYTITFTVGGNCPTVTTTIVTIVGAPEPGIGGDLEVCEQSDIVELNDLLEGEDQGGIWTNAEGEEIDAQFDPVAVGENILTYSVGNAPCTVASSSVTVNVVAEPNSGVASSSTIFCEIQNQVALDQLITEEQSGGVWTDADNNTIQDTLFFSGAGDATLSYTVSNETCGERTTEVDVTILALPDPAMSIGEDVFCQDEEIDLDDLLVETHPNGQWIDPDGEPSSNMVIVSEIGNQTFDYVITLEPCPSVTTEVTFEVVEADLPGTPSEDGFEFCDQDSIFINLLQLLDNPDAGGVWTDSTDTVVDSNIDLAPLSAGSYDFTYTISNPECGDVSTTVTLVLSDEFCELPPIEQPPLEFEIPQGFSPNGDGINDLFVINGLNELFPNNSMLIFNRWGAEVLNSAPYNNDWDGRADSGINNGELLPVGTYWYILDLGNGTEPIMDFIYLNR